MPHVFDLHVLDMLDLDPFDVLDLDVIDVVNCPALNIYVHNRWLLEGLVYTMPGQL